MYTLYYSQGACSLATQVILRELGAQFTLKNKQEIPDFSKVSPVGAVPVLHNGERNIREGAAILLYLLEQHENRFLDKYGSARTTTIQNIMFANASVHPAYSKLFFLAANMPDSPIKMSVMKAAAKDVERLWDVVAEELAEREYLGGEQFSPADVLLAVYSRWNEYFDVDIKIPEKVQRMLSKVIQLPSFQASLNAESDLAA